jgi:hypothetical protein
MYETFMAALHARHAIRLTFCAEEDGAIRTRICYPMDYGPSRKFHDGQDRYWFWDCDSPDGPHTLGLLPSQVSSMTDTTDVFDPAWFITGRTKWQVARDWGSLS